MPTTPEGIQTVTLHGLFVEPNLPSTPLQGTITFTPSPTMITFPDQNVIIAGTETVTLDVNGEFSIDLICTDTANQIPNGWTYSVTEKLVGIKSRTYNILLPYTLATIELADITPTEIAPTYLPVVGPQGPPGFINSVNGYHLINVVLNAADVGAIATTARGAANGVASLDGSSLVPVAQIPSLSGTYIPLAQKAAASGVASLDAGTKVPSAQLDLATAAGLTVANAGAVGVATKLAREDHVHAGMDLTTAQTAAGAKTFSSSVFVMGAGFGVGISSSLAGLVDMRTASAGTTILNLQNTSGASTAALLKINGDTAASTLIVSLVTGDSVNRFAMKGSGQLEFGSGAGARDANFYRSGVGILNSSGQFAADAAAPLLAAHLTRKDYVDAINTSAVHIAGAETVTGAKTFTAVQQLQATVSTVVQQHRVTGDTNNRLQITSDGVMTWGSGSGTGDVTLYREAADVLTTDDTIRAYRPLTTNNALQLRVVGDTVSRLAVNADGKMAWGAGGASTSDANFYRVSAGLLTTDTALSVGTSLAVGTSLSVGTNLTVTGNLTVGGIGQVVQATKSANETVTSSTTLQNDDDLVLALAASATYQIWGWVKYSQNLAISGTSGIVVGFTIPAGATWEWSSHGTAGTASATTYDTVLATGTGTRSLASNGATTMTFAPIGNLTTTSAGSLQMQWAQVSSSATPTTVYLGSWLQARRTS